MVVLPETGDVRGSDPDEGESSTEASVDALDCNAASIDDDDDVTEALTGGGIKCCNAWLALRRASCVAAARCSLRGRRCEAGEYIEDCLLREGSAMVVVK